MGLRLGLAGLLSGLEGVQELIIVVGPTDAAYANDLIFVEPGERSKSSWFRSYTEWRYRLYDFNAARRVPSAPQPAISNYSWSILATEMRDIIPQ
jgi:hypothetical protein